jgi:lactoylglutathione lyase
MTGGSRPFRVLGLQQVAIGGLDRSSLRHLWCDLLGLARVGSYQSVSENVLEDILQLGPESAPVEVDLMQPLDPAKAPRVHQPPLNHVGLWVDDLGAAYQWLEAQGVRFAPGGIRVGAAGYEVCFIHPKPSADKLESGQGVLIELVQAPPEVIAKLGPSPG